MPSTARHLLPGEPISYEEFLLAPSPDLLKMPYVRESAGNISKTSFLRHPHSVMSYPSGF
jgi:hypothetical protein